MLKKKLLPLFIVILFISGASLIAEEVTPPEPAKVSISLDLNSLNCPFHTNYVSLKKEQELIVIVNIDDQHQYPQMKFHNKEASVYDTDTRGKNSYFIDTELDKGEDGFAGDFEYAFSRLFSDHIQQKKKLNTDGNPMTYHFKSTNSPGTTFIYFLHKIGFFTDYFIERIQVAVQ